MADLFACFEQLRLLTAYNEAIGRCYGSPNRIRLAGEEKDEALEALIASLSAYQQHLKTHHCAPCECNQESVQTTVESPASAEMTFRSSRRVANGPAGRGRCWHSQR